MKYIDEFRDNKIAKNISRAIFEKAGTSGPVNIMEVIAAAGALTFGATKPDSKIFATT